MWRCKGQRYRNGLWPLAEHHMSQTITWYESALSHYSGSNRLLHALWEICDWVQWRLVHSVKCTYVCGGGLLPLAAESHYVAGSALRLLSLVSYEDNWKFTTVLCLLWFSFETLCGRSVENTVCSLCVSTVCSARVHVYVHRETCLRVYGRFLVSACVCVLFVCIFQRVILKESDSRDGENATDVSLPQLRLCVEPIQNCYM